MVEFTMVLPSNSNLSIHPNNQPEEYTVRLAKRVSLLEGDWEAALVNLHFTNSVWPVYFVQDAAVYWMWIDTVEENFNMDRANGQSTGIQVDNGNGIIWVKDAWKRRHTSANSVKFRKGQFFKTVQSFAEHIRTSIDSNITTNARKPSIYWVYDQATKSYQFTCDSGLLFLFTEKTWMGDVLGMKSNPPTNSDSNGYLLGSRQQSKIMSHDSIYVYCDIFEKQLVGDTETPLIGIIPVQVGYGERQFYALNSLLYLPIHDRQLSEVRIKLCDSRGALFPFTRGDFNTVVTLRFRRRKTYI